jgi:hypothetical protein
VVLYACKTWTLTLREEHRLKIQGGIFGPKRDEVTEGWRKLHNEDLRELYSSPIIIRIIKSRSMRGAGHVARMGKKRNAYISSYSWNIKRSEIGTCKIYL